jgi:hypothetical protein
MKRPIISTLALLVVTPAAAQTAESVFTDFNTDQCRHLPGTVEEDYGEWHCKGYGGIAVWMGAGDQRVMISFGPRASREPAARQTLASFNGEGKRIEWRLSGGTPFAAIMRWSTTKLDDNYNPLHGEVLVVTRLPPGAVCHVGYVDGLANKDAEALARKIADEHAQNFDCSRDKAFVLGDRGPGFSEATNLGE